MRALAVCASGRVVASGHGEGTVRLWDAESGRTRWEPSALPDKVQIILYGPHPVLSRAAIRTLSDEDMTIQLDGGLVAQ